jgi:hypothetical protein
MKKKFAASALALSVLVGGASLSSASASALPSEAKSISVEPTVVGDSKAEPMFWAALGRGVAWGVGWALGEKAVKGSSAQNEVSYDYEEVKESFDY